MTTQANSNKNMIKISHIILRLEFWIITTLPYLFTSTVLLMSSKSLNFRFFVVPIIDFPLASYSPSIYSKSLLKKPLLECSWDSSFWVPVLSYLSIVSFFYDEEKSWVNRGLTLLIASRETMLLDLGASLVNLRFSPISLPKSSFWSEGPCSYSKAWVSKIISFREFCWKSWAMGMPKSALKCLCF
jgi:hypothetical protein